jgi:CubicO group peptidase (beta-lactamase class C family)
MLDFAPGARSQYSNFGYLLASALVEKVTGTDYFAYVKNTLLEPEGITEVEIRPTAANQQPSTEAMIEDEGLGLSALDPLSPPARAGNLRRRWPGQGGSCCKCWYVGFGHRTDSVHPPACGLGQRWSGTQLGALRQHSGFVNTRLVTRRRRRLGLCHQHAQLAADHVAHAGRSGEYDQQAA